MAVTDTASAIAGDLGALAAQILDRAEDAVSVLDREWRFVYANRRACEMWGNGPETILGRRIWDCFSGLRDGEAGRRLRRAAKCGCPQEFEAVIAGLGRPMRLRVEPLGDGLIAVFWRQISSSAAALRDSEERLLLAQQGAGIGIWDWNLETAEIVWSPQMFHLLGADPVRDASDLYGAWLRAVHPDDRERAHALSRRRLVEPGPSEFDFRVLLPDGAIRWVLAKGMAVTTAGGRPVRVVGINIDITERKLAEARFHELAQNLEARVDARTRELAEVNDRLRRERLLSQLIVENTAEGIIVVDTDLRYLLWNAGMERINGMPRRAMLGRTPFEVFPHLTDSPVGQAWRDAVRGQKTEMRGRRYFSPARGVEIIYDSDHTPLYDQSGAIIGAVCIVRETTERHRIEEMLRQSQKLEAVAQLTGGVAHDFNNLLTALVGCLDLILREENGARTVKLAETALHAADRGAQLTQQLLSFARRQALRPVVADLNALLAAIEVLIGKAVGETIETVFDRAPDLAHCEVDPAQFEAAVMNLAVNARDAMPQGGRLILATRNAEIRDVPAELDLPPGDYVALSIRDTGDGMPPDVAARAFEPFFTTKEIGKGSGLGLSMVHGFVKQSGGGVQLDSAPCKGTCVTLFLPRAAAAAAAVVRDEEADEPQFGSGSILIVEDNEEVREVSVAILRSLGYRVRVAGNGREALDTLRRPGRVDLLFTDVVMPGGLSGLALGRQARQLRPGLKVLLTSGYAGQQAEGAGEFPMIAKPFRAAQLSRAVAALLKGGKDRDWRADRG